MKKIVIIGANSFQNRLIEKAKDMGFETHVFAWAAGDIGEKTADHFYPISITEKERILDECRRIRPDAICSIASDLAVLTVNYVARALGLPANSELCDHIATNKHAMRAAFEAAGLYTPKNCKVTEADFEDDLKRVELRYPVIVKPTDRSGSRAITKLDSEAGLREAVRQAIGQSFERAAIVEEYIEGKEFSCEGISRHGRHTMLAITEKFTTEAPHYIETGHIEPAPLDDQTADRVWDVLTRALDALHIENGASHAEFRIGDDGEVKIIEIGARMGGDCIGSDLVALSTGNDYVKMVIQTALGEEPEIRAEKLGKAAAIRFFMDREEPARFLRRRDEIKGLVTYEIEKDLERSVTDSGSRYGFFIVSGEDHDSVYNEVCRSGFGF